MDLKASIAILDLAENILLSIGPLLFAAPALQKI